MALGSPEPLLIAPELMACLYTLLCIVGWHGRQVGQGVDGMGSANVHGHPHWRIDIVCKMYAKPTQMLLLARVTFQICLFNPDSLFVFVLIR